MTATTDNIPKTTLLLDPATWDLTLDAEGNLALADTPYASEQDVASQLQTWLGECFYDTTQGLPLEQAILGKKPTIGAINSMVTACALQVPGVISVSPSLSITTDGRLAGTVSFTLSTGQTGSVAV